MTETQGHNRIDDVAAHWVARCDHGSLSAEEQARLDNWLAADLRHWGAWARANAVFSHFDRARALGDSFDPDHFAQAKNGSIRHGRRRFLYWAGAAMAASVAGVAFFNQPRRRISTQLGEVLREPLEDGSVVTLNSDSSIEVIFEHSRRLIRLVRGEALFEVAHDAIRPFIVTAAHARIVATGTRFSVQLAIAAVEVLVSEGSVELDAYVDSPRISPVTLTANMMAMAISDLRISTQALPPIEINRRLAWRDGVISFNGDTLASAATQFSRYSRQRIIIDDPIVAQRRVVGLYSANDPAGFAHSVALSLHLDAHRSGDRIYLRRPDKEK